MPGDNSYKPTDSQRNAVKLLVAAGISEGVICQAIGINWRTLSKHFKQEIETGRAFVYAQIAGRVVQKAMQGDNACMFFVLKTRFGWREVNRHEHTGADGGSIVVEDLRGLEMEHLKKAIDATRPRICAPEAGGGVHQEDLEEYLEGVV